MVNLGLVFKGVVNTYLYRNPLISPIFGHFWDPNFLEIMAIFHDNNVFVCFSSVLLVRY